MTGYRFHAHVGVRVQPPAASVSEFVRVRHAVPVTIPRVRGEECPLAATCAGASQGPRAAPVLIRRMPDGFYVEVLGPRNERLGEDEFSELAATSGTMGSRGVVAWPSNPFGDPPAHGPDRYPALGRGSDGYEAAVGKARSRAAALVSVDGIVHARRVLPGWRVGDEGGAFAVRATIPGGSPGRHFLAAGRELSTYCVDVPFDRRDALDGILVGGRLVVSGETAARAPVPAPPQAGWIAPSLGSGLPRDVRAAEAIGRMRAASPWLAPETPGAALAWRELRALGTGGADPARVYELLSSIADRERAGPAPTLGTVAWMELTWLSAMGCAR